MRRAAIPALASLVLAGVVASLSMATAARADYEPVGSGVIKLSLSNSFLVACRANSVRLSAVAPARLAGGVLTVPAVGGRFDPVAARGTVEGEGALVLTAKGGRIPIKELKLRTSQPKSPFSAKVGGSQLKIATAQKVDVSRSGFDDKVTVSELTLSANLATRLGKKLGLKQVFRGGMPLGTSSTLASPMTVSMLEKGAATLTLDPGFAAKLQSLFVAVNPIFPAEHQGFVFTLPIFGGAISTGATVGRLETLGQLEFLQLGGGQVFWREPWMELESSSFGAEVDIEPSPPYPGKVGGVTVAASTLSGPVTADAPARTVSAGFALTLDSATAQAFEEAFAAPQGKRGVFIVGEAVASVAFTAQGQ